MSQLAPSWRSRARSPSDAAWTTLVVKIPPEDHAAVCLSAAAAAATLASATEVEEKSASPWHLDDENASQVLIAELYVWGPGNDSQGFEHLQSIIRTQGCAPKTESRSFPLSFFRDRKTFGRERSLAEAYQPSGSRIDDNSDPDAFPLKLLDASFAVYIASPRSGGKAAGRS